MEKRTQKVEGHCLYLKYKDGKEPDKYVVVVITGRQADECILKYVSKMSKLFLTLPNVNVKPLKAVESI